MRGGELSEQLSKNSFRTVAGAVRATVRPTVRTVRASTVRINCPNSEFGCFLVPMDCADQAEDGAAKKSEFRRLGVENWRVLKSHLKRPVFAVRPTVRTVAAPTLRRHAKYEYDVATVGHAFQSADS